MTRRLLFVVLSFLLPAVVLADRPIILVTPAGVFQSVSKDGVPGAWMPLEADVIVQGFGGGGNSPPVPPAPPSDPVVEQVKVLSKATLRTSDEAMALAAVIDSLSRNGLSGRDFVGALVMAGRIADTSLSAGGRIERWVTSATTVTADATLLKAGLVAAFDLKATELKAIARAVDDPDAEPTAAAFDFAQIIALVQMIIELLKNLGII